MSSAIALVIAVIWLDLTVRDARASPFAIATSDEGCEIDILVILDLIFCDTRESSPCTIVTVPGLIASGSSERGIAAAADAVVEVIDARILPATRESPLTLVTVPGLMAAGSSGPGISDAAAAAEPIDVVIDARILRETLESPLTLVTVPGLMAAGSSGPGISAAAEVISDEAATEEEVIDARILRETRESPRILVTVPGLMAAGSCSLTLYVDPCVPEVASSESIVATRGPSLIRFDVREPDFFRMRAAEELSAPTELAPGFAVAASTFFDDSSSINSLDG
mmetsp:Transcript_5690/g.8248  ORF Transcript_5690/g.8248 Transcript_5690/m.8248 type:complete len:282 (-) Transcript_5690:10-855(-)